MSFSNLDPQMPNSLYRSSHPNSNPLNQSMQLQQSNAINFTPENDLKNVLDSFTRSCHRNSHSVDNNFKIPVYSYCKDRSVAYAQNQEQKFKSNDPAYQNLWERCHRSNASEDVYCTSIIIGLDQIEKKQQESLRISKMFCEEVINFIKYNLG